MTLQVVIIGCSCCWFWLEMLWDECFILNTAIKAIAPEFSYPLPVNRASIAYEPEMELLTIFWQPPHKNQMATELGDGVILIKNETTGEPIDKV